MKDRGIFLGELCGELVCVPHLNFASVSAMVYDYAEFSCHGVALNVNTESESAYVGEWTKLDRAPANVSSLALVKRGAIWVGTRHRHRPAR